MSSGKKVIESKYPKALNIGILEQATTSFAAGLSKVGFIPIVHTIASFMVDRAFEQLKIDFGYQKLNGNFISVGGSYDYAALGCTHHCPGDIAVLKTLPGMQIVVPGTPNEFDLLNVGVTVIIYANHLLRSAYPSMVNTAQSILENGRSKEASDKYCMSIKDIITLIPEID